jgi:predicted porin
MINNKLMAVAVAGALAAPGFAMAQATTAGTNVQVYGLFDQAVRQDRYSNTTTTTGYPGNLTKWHMHNGAPNRLGFRGTEALGGGMTAFFQVESQVFMDGRADNAAGAATNATVGGRPTFMGLRAGWGEVSIGYQESVYKDVYSSTWQVGPTQPHFGTIMGMGNTTGAVPAPAAGTLAATCTGGQASGIGNAGITGGTTLCGTEAQGNSTSFNRTVSDTVQYRSPVISGFRYSTQLAMAEYKENATATINNTTGFSQYKPSYSSHSLTWSGGPFSAAMGYEIHRGFRAINTPYTDRNSKDTALSMGVRWNYGMGLLAAGWERLKYGDSSGNNAIVAASRTTSNSFDINNWTVQGTYNITPSDVAAIGYSKTPGAKNCGNGFSTTTGVFGGSGSVGNAACGSAGSANMVTLTLDHSFSKRTALYAQYSRINNGAGSTYYYIAGPTSNSGLGLGGTVGAGTDVSTYGLGMKHTF